MYVCAQIQCVFAPADRIPLHSSALSPHAQPQGPREEGGDGGKEETKNKTAKKKEKKKENRIPNTVVLKLFTVSAGYTLCLGKCECVCHSFCVCVGACLRAHSPCI